MHTLLVNLRRCSRCRRRRALRSCTCKISVIQRRSRKKITQPPPAETAGLPNPGGVDLTSPAGLLGTAPGVAEAPSKAYTRLDYPYILYFRYAPRKKHKPGLAPNTSFVFPVVNGFFSATTGAADAVAAGAAAAFCL